MCRTKGVLYNIPGALLAYIKKIKHPVSHGQTHGTVQLMAKKQLFFCSVFTYIWLILSPACVILWSTPTCNVPFNLPLV